MDYTLIKNYSLSVWDYHNNKLIDLKTPNISIYGQSYGAKLKLNINGLKELDFILPLFYLDNEGVKTKNLILWDYIQSERLVKLEYNNTYDWFIIKSYDEVRSDNGSLLSNIQCKHISNLLTQSGLDLYIDEVGNAENLLTKILNNSGWTVGTVDTFEKEGVEKIRSLKTERSNRYNAIQDLCDLFECYPVFNPDKTVDLKIEVGDNHGITFRYSKNLKNIKRTIGNSDVITKLWVEGGNDDVGLVTISDINPTGENYILDFSYFIDGGFLSQIQLDAIDNFETQVASTNSDISTQLTNINTAYSSKLEKESVLEGKNITKTTKSQLKEEIDLQIQTETNSTTKATLQSQSNQLQTEINTLNTEISTLNSEITSLENNIDTYEDNLSTEVDTKNSLISTLHSSLSDFIREGLWQDGNYIDSQSLYDDALKQSQTYAYPQVVYDMGILDLSVLTEYAIEKFNLGDIIRIIDENLAIDTLARITEISIDLDKPQNVSVQIGTYYSNFEDLFKKISQSAEIIKQRQQIYERAVGINPDGTIAYDILQETFNNNLFRVVSGTNNNVVQDNKGITVTDIADENKKVRINAGGVFLTTDGGTTWKIGLSADGISALNVTSGVIDTKLLQIWNSSQPRFKWNADGLYAFGDDGSGNVDTNKYIKFNEDGFFFTLDGGLTYEAAWTWGGLVIGGISAEDLESVQGSQEKANNGRDEAKGYVDTQLSDFANTVTSDISDLQNQIDGNITTWFYDGVPTLSNEPTVNWTTDDDKNVHLGDIYYDNLTEYAYRFKVVTTVYSWELIKDSDITTAIQQASQAQDTADAKRRVFVSQPITPYDVGDLWSQGDSGDLMRCSTARLSGGYVAGDWEKASKYTDDTTANEALNLADTKNTVFYSDNAPSTSNRKIGDVWFDTNNGNKISYWNGSSWASSLFGTSAIANLAITDALISNVTAGKIDTNTLSAIVANLGEVTAGILRNTADTVRFDLNSNYLKINHSDGSYSRMDQDGFKRFESGTGRLYQYRTYTGQGSVISSIASSTGIDITLPSDFQGKNFNVILALEGYTPPTGYGVVKARIYKSGHNSANGTFKVSGSVIAKKMGLASVWDIGDNLKTVISTDYSDDYNNTTLYFTYIATY